MSGKSYRQNEQKQIEIARACFKEKRDSDKEYVLMEKEGQADRKRGGGM